MSGETRATGQILRLASFPVASAIVSTVATVAVWGVFAATRQPVLSIPVEIVLGEVEPNGAINVKIPIHNNTDRPIRCIGIPSRCDLGCTGSAGIPFTVWPGQTHVSVMKFHAPSVDSVQRRGITDPRLREEVQLFFDCTEVPQRTVALCYTQRPEED